MTVVEFKRLAAQGFNRIPVVVETFADLDTPLSIYLKLANKPYSYLLESVQGGERFGRYSFIGLASSTRINVRGGTVLVLSGNRIAERADAGDPLAFINTYLKRFKVAALPGLPRFCGELLAALRAPAQIPAETPQAGENPQSAFGEAGYKVAVERAKRYIHDGDVMQVVLSQRLSLPFVAEPLALYRALRTLNPSPYMFYFDFEDFHVVGASPEILVRLEDGKVTLRPIAGPRRRGATPEEDEALAAELLADEKERAEHLMLLDLGRNDVGRVAKTGSVKVTERFVVEKYSHVMHIVSNVEGDLKDDEGALGVLRATFPAGTVSGAPKVRAMEIIDELEPVKRGIYAGAVGYLGFNRDMDLAIAIRTAVIKNGDIHVQVGAGIVADSDPDSEWIETQNKARALLAAAEMA